VIELPALRIRAVGARGLDLALARPVETATGTMRTGPLVLIDLATEEGIVGRCYLRCYTPVALQPLVQLVANLGDLVRGDAAAPEAVEQKLQRHLRLLGPQGLTGIAVAGIDMALWDACAKAAHMSLVRLLGGDPTPLPAHASLRTMRPSGAAADAEAAVARGFTAIKLKLGWGELAADLEAIQAVRRAVGNEVDLMVDYNQSLSVAEALDHAGPILTEPIRIQDGRADTLAAARSSADPGRASPAARPRRKGPERDWATLSSCQRPALRSGDRSPSRLERSAVVAVQCHVPRESV
jgi:L-alanine-DL-glutamate epimerase-like enolase superfamily enzyme